VSKAEVRRNIKRRGAIRTRVRVRSEWSLPPAMASPITVTF
jgi:hypothetical protein